MLIDTQTDTQHDINWVQLIWLSKCLFHRLAYRHFPRFVISFGPFAQIVVKIPIHQTCHKTKEKFAAEKVLAHRRHRAICVSVSVSVSEWQRYPTDSNGVAMSDVFCVIFHIISRSIWFWDVCFSTDMVALPQSKRRNKRIDGRKRQK